MIRPIKIEDKKDWEKLYRGYADFYKVEMNDEVKDIISRTFEKTIYRESTCF